MPTPHDAALWPPRRESDARSGGDELSTAVFGALEFRKIGNATPEQRGIAAKAEEALQLIANESPLNRHRMKKYGLA
jgi:hypothetical protein